MIWLKIYNYIKNIAEENVRQEFRLKNIYEIRNWRNLIGETNRNKLMSEKYKKVCAALN